MRRRSSSSVGPVAIQEGNRKVLKERMRKRGRDPSRLGGVSSLLLPLERCPFAAEGR